MKLKGLRVFGPLFEPSFVVEITIQVCGIKIKSQITDVRSVRGTWSEVVIRRGDLRLKQV